jgi:hypothetical protein
VTNLPPPSDPADPFSRPPDPAAPLPPPPVLPPTVSLPPTTAGAAHAPGGPEYTAPMPAAPTTAIDPYAPGGTPPMTDPTMSAERGRKWGLIVVATLLVIAVAVIAAIIATSGGDDEESSPDTTEVEQTVPESTTPATEPAPTTTEPAGTTVPETTDVPATTAPAPSNFVDLGFGVGFDVPAGYTLADVNNGQEISDGTTFLFAQVESFEPGRDPLTIAQEYIDSFDAQFTSVTYSQAIPSPLPSPVMAGDSYTIYYRALNEDGSGFKGVIDTGRRADGLLFLSDLYTDINAPDDQPLPQTAFDQLVQSFAAATAVGATVELAPLPVARTTSVHPVAVLDGLLQFAAPPTWTIENAGPGRFVMNGAAGGRITAARLPDTVDPAAAQAATVAELASVFPGATVAPFQVITDADGVQLSTATFTGAAGAGTVEGQLYVWVDTVRTQAFGAGVAYATGARPPEVELDFVLRALDISLIAPR